MPNVTVELTLEDLSSALEQLNDAEIREILGKIRDLRKKEILEQGYRQLAQISFDDIGSEEEWIKPENEIIENFERDLS